MICGILSLVGYTIVLRSSYLEFGIFGGGPEAYQLEYLITHPTATLWYILGLLLGTLTLGIQVCLVPHYAAII
jgi:hypothetical protein